MSAEENKAIVLRLYEAFNHNDPAVIDEILAPNFVDNSSSLGRTAGPEGLRHVVNLYHEAFPDMLITVDKIMAAENDCVVVMEDFRGTHAGVFTVSTPDGDLLRTPPTHRQATMSGINVFRLADGRIVERWGEENKLSLLQQLNVVSMESEEQSRW
jgi:predicted ester cyclase